VLDPNAHPVAKGNLCGQHAGFNLHAATRVVANDKKGRETLCKYILRPPLANDRLHILPDGNVRLEFKRAWSDGTSSIELEPLALVAALRLWFLRPSGMSRAILAYSPHIAASAASACLPPCPSRPPRKKTSLREPCRSHTIFPGANCSEERSELTLRVLAAKARCASSL